MIFGKERGIALAKGLSIDYTQEELNKIPYYSLDIRRISSPDNTREAGVKYEFRCKSCFRDYDIFCIELELFINRRVKEASEQANITGLMTLRKAMICI